MSRAKSCGDHLGVQGGAAGGDAAQCVDELLHAGDAVLEQVADAAGAVGEQLAGVLPFHVLGQHQDRQPRPTAARLDGGAQAFVAERRWQAHVDDGDVGTVHGDASSSAGALPTVRPPRSRCGPAAAPAPREGARCPRRSRPAWQLHDQLGRPAGRAATAACARRGRRRAPDAGQPGAVLLGCAAAAVVADQHVQGVAAAAYPTLPRCAGCAWRRWLSASATVK